MSLHELSPDAPGRSQSTVANRCRERRRGGTNVLFVLALPILLGVGALAIDLALMSLAAQRVQNVADTAALAGAVQVADTTASEVAVDQTAGTNNDFSPWQVNTTVTRYGPGQEVPGFRTLGYREHVVAVEGTTNFTFAFARLFGLEQATVTRDAAAMCEVWRNRLAEGFVFAGSTDPAVWGVYSDGKDNQFGGDIHSNTGISMNGLNNTVTGDIKYRNAYEQSGDGFTHYGTVMETPVEPYPVDFCFEDFTQDPWDYEVASIYETASDGSLPSGRWHVLGDMTINATGFQCTDSLFVVEGNIYLAGAGSVYENCTVVARGDIDMAFADGSFSPLMHDLFAFTEKTSTADVMTIDGSRTQASGVLFAPNGGLHFEGSPMHTYEVGLVANTVTLIGSGMTHNGPASALTCDETSKARLVQ